MRNNHGEQSRRAKLHVQGRLFKTINLHQAPPPGACCSSSNPNAVGNQSQAHSGQAARQRAAAICRHRGDQNRMTNRTPSTAHLRVTRTAICVLPPATVKAERKNAGRARAPVTRSSSRCRQGAARMALCSCGIILLRGAETSKTRVVPADLLFGDEGPRPTSSAKTRATRFADSRRSSKIA